VSSVPTPISRSAVPDASRQPSRKRGASVWRRAWANRSVYIFIVPGLLWYVVFHYLPILGNVIAWKDYSVFTGIWESPWVGWQNFQDIFTDPAFRVALVNTLQIELLQLIFAFPVPLALALLLNSLVNERLKRGVQSVVYLPHFLSWVIVIAMWQQIFGGDGFLNQLLLNQGFERVSIMNNPDIFKPLVVLQSIWKDAGWGTIIFLAALTKIDVQLYEAAAMDGAGGWRRLVNITLPGIRPVIVLLLILRLGSMLSVGFEQYFLQRGAVGPDAAEVLDTFVYFRGVVNGDWSFAAAVGLVRAIVGAVLIFTANWFAKRFFDEGIF